MCSTQCSNVCSKMCHPKTTQINKDDRGFKMAPAQSFDRGLLKSRMCGSMRNKAQEEALSISHPAITAFYLIQLFNNPDTSNQKKRLQMTHRYQPGLWIM